MSEIDKIRELFASFEKSGSLESLAEAIEIVEDVLKNGDAGDKEIAKNCFTTNKNKQIEDARRILEEEDDFRKVKECRKALEEFEGAELANSLEDKVELEKFKDELSKKEGEVKPKLPEELKAQQDENNLRKRMHDKLILKKAKEQGITVTEGEIEEYLEKSRNQREKDAPDS